MQGRGATSIFDKDNKWHTINRYINENKIGILCLQETHLSDEQTTEINNNLHKLKVFTTTNPDHPNAQGVAIALNKQLINTLDTTIDIIIPGRAMLITNKWHESDKITILAIYAPNNTQENKEFWNTLNDIWESPTNNRPKPNIMTGDFNLTEDAIDRSNGKQDEINATVALMNLKYTLGLADGWRRTNPTTKEYTLLHRSNGHQSRIDRIYATNEIIANAEDWNINHSPVNSDHKIISVKIAHKNAPFLGRGRWAIQPHTLGNKRFIKDVEKAGIESLEEIELLASETLKRTEEYNVQTIWKKLKNQIKNTAQEYAKKPISFLDRRANELDLKLKLINNDPLLSTDEKTISAMMIEEERREIERKRLESKKQNTAARFRMEGETISKYWVNINKEKKPRDTIPKLKRWNPETQTTEIITRSDKMADHARNYHNNLQIDPNPPTEEERTTAITNTLTDNLPKLSNKAKSKLTKKINKLETSIALASASNGKAAGLDGIPYELWKLLNERNTNLKKENKEGFDIIHALTIVFNDVEKHGISKETNFNEGWMCPIYKKNDKTDIANYRPITALNTDYKLMTKALQAKLAKAAPEIIHYDQTGFMKGRSIFDQIKAIQLTTEYAELTEEINGAIVALDQEKAYDKIKHDYLWITLQKTNIPQNFINTVKSLYTNAETKIIINGEISEPFTVKRGVRQGDPLSCLLFNLAIEPLAHAIRNSNLTGLKIPKLREHMKVLLFADDTTVFLNEKDSYEELIQLLDKWCAASGAKFNKSKTEIIPIGTETHCEQMRQTRRLNRNDNQIPIGTSINNKGELVRILGAWFGNTTSEQPWSTIIETTQSQLTRWGKSNPTIEGTRLINQMETGGRTQYLTKAQGMPLNIEQHIERIIRKFTWSSDRAQVAMKQMALPLRRGGRRVLDIKKRNLAIAATDLQSYLKMDNSRPKWAYIADEIFRRAYDPSLKHDNEDPRINPFIQKWPAAKAIRTLTKNTKKLLKTAKKLRLRIDADVIDEKLKRQMPIWMHPDLREGERQTTFTSISKHLRKDHKIQTVQHAFELARTYINENHQESSECECPTCTELERKYNCPNPNACVQHAKALIGKLNTKWKPRILPLHTEKQDAWQRKQESLARDPKEKVFITEKTSTTKHMSDIFRIMTNDTTPTPTPKHRLPTNNMNTTTIYTDGGCKNNGTLQATAGSGIFFAENDPRNLAIRTPGKEQSNQTGEIYAVIKALDNAPDELNVQIISDSMYTIKSLTTNLDKTEDQGWINTSNKNKLLEAIEKIRTRRGNTTFKWTKGHANDPGNEAADKLATKGMSLPIPHQADYLYTGRTTGAKLSKITQSLIYKALLEEEKSGETKRTHDNVERIQSDMTDSFHTAPTYETLWRMLKQSKNIYKTQREFIFKSIKGIQKVGSYWGKIPNYEERATCGPCGRTESMEHILTNCEIPGQEEAWELAQSLWDKKYRNWEKPTYGCILGSPTLQFKKDDGKTDSGKTRLYQILISETTYLIWTMRCRRVIEHENDQTKWPRKNMIKKQLEDRLSLRLRMDCLQSNEQNFKTKAINKKKVISTWSGLIHNETNLEQDWLKIPGVLVGIRLKYKDETLTNR